MTTIHVRLLEEGTQVSRPAEAEEVSPRVFRLLPSDSYDPNDEHWEFIPGSVVEVERVEDRQGAYLLAVRLAEHN